MNRRRFLTSVPVLAAYGFVAAMVGRLFGSERRKRMSAGVLRREPWHVAGGDGELMASWEEGPKPKAEVGSDGGFVIPDEIAELMRRQRICPQCRNEQRVILWTREPIFTGDKGGCVTYRPGSMVVALACGHKVRVT